MVILLFIILVLLYSRKETIIPSNPNTNSKTSIPLQEKQIPSIAPTILSAPSNSSFQKKFQDKNKALPPSLEKKIRAHYTPYLDSDKNLEIIDQTANEIDKGKEQQKKVVVVIRREGHTTKSFNAIINTQSGKVIQTFNQVKDDSVNQKEEKFTPDGTLTGQ